MNQPKICVLGIWVIALFVASAARATAPIPDPEKVPVLTPKDIGYINCRIPGIVVTTKGTLLAYCEARKGKGGDWDPIEILLRRSTDAGRTWAEEPRKIAGDGKQTFNNPVAIVDSKDGVIHFLYCIEYARCFYMRSDDDGKSFSEPVEITAAFEPFKKDYAWDVIATGPTHGIQLMNGRLLVPVWLSTGGKKHHPSVVATIYSDDHGKTWKHGDIAVTSTADVPDPNETVAVELLDGKVMLNSRNESTKSRRVTVTSADGATGWSKPAFDEALVEPICNASIIRLSFPGGGHATGRIVFANPNSTEAVPNRKPAAGKGPSYKRQNLTLRLSTDDGKTWTASRAVEPGPSGYSDLAVGPDLTIYCLYEKSGGLTLARVMPDWLTSGKP